MAAQSPVASGGSYVDSSKLLLPVALELLSESDGDFPYARYPKSRALEDGFDTMTIRELANAVDNVAYYLLDKLGDRPKSKVLAYLGPNGPYTSVAFIAAIKAGYQIYLPSERNSLPAQLSLLEALNCTVILTPSRTFPPVQSITDAAVIEAVELPPLVDATTPPKKVFPFSRNYEIHQNSICFIVHTSGTTGFPKPIRIPFEAVTRMARCLTLPEVRGHQTMYSMLRGKSCIDLLPVNHPAGINVGILNAIYNKYTVILPPPGVPPTAHTLCEMADRIDADWAAMAPLTMEQLSKDPISTEKVINKLSMLFYSGGSLPKVFGDTISPKVRLLSGMGSSETGPMPLIYPEGFDWVAEWEYLKFHPAVNAVFDPLPDGNFELTQQKTDESEQYQVAFMRPGVGNEFRTKDLFVPHPSKDGLWTHVSRSDDVIVLLNGEKVNPVQFESIIASHPRVSAALMFGAQRFEVGLLLELAASSDTDLSQTQKAVVLDDIWGKVTEANALLPGHGKIDKAHVLFTSSDRPVMRTLKNTVRRQPTLDQYKDRITKLYADVEEMWVPKQAPRSISLVDMRVAVVDALHEHPQFAHLRDGDDFFEAGMNSLQVLRLVRSIKQATSVEDLDPSVIYRSPTISSLAEAVYLLSNRLLSDTGQYINYRETQMRKLRDTLYTQQIAPLKEITKFGTVQASEQDTVVLTGSTGYIGRYVLRSLLNTGNVKHIYSLNRSVDSASVQSQRNASTDLTLPVTFDTARVTFLQADLAAENLGLRPEIYQKLVSEATHIIHSAWQVDFNLPLSFFEPSLRGLTNLIEVCRRSLHHARLMFISSISSAVRSKSEVPEDVIADTSACAPVGYAESKWIGESLCKHASEELGIPCIVARLGQVSGAVDSPGSWNPTDWLPSLVVSSAFLGAIPERLPDGAGNQKNIHWMPIDTIADVLVELLVQDDDDQALRVYQPLHPRAVSWHSLLEGVISCMKDRLADSSDHGAIETVSATEWVRRLRDSGSDNSLSVEDLLRQNPALKLKELFEALYTVSRDGDGNQLFAAMTWNSSNAQKDSKHLREARVITGKDMQRWTGYWFAQMKQKMSV